MLKEIFTRWFPRQQSSEALEAIQPRTQSLREAALEVLVHSTHGAGFTADEIAEALGESPLAIRPRLTELRGLGRVRPTGERRPNASGRSATVWAACA